jgi:outer membrane protein
MKSGNWIIAIGCACFLLGASTIVTGSQSDAMLQSGDQGSSTLLSIYRQAWQNDPEHLGALQRLAAQRESLPQAKSNLWPTITLNGEYAENYQDIISSDNTVYGSGSTDFSSYQYTLTLTQPIFAYSSFVRVKQAKLEVKRTDVEEKILSQELILRVTERYLQALAAMDELSFTRIELKSIKRQYDIAEEKQRTGLARITDVDDARARLASVKARELEAENILADTLQGLQELTGKTPGSLAVLRNEIPLVSPDPSDIKAWVTAALDQNLSLAVKRQAVEIAQAEIKRQRGGHYPTVDLVGSHNYSDTEGTLFGGGSEVKNSHVFLRASLPIFQGGYVNSKVREATSMYQKSQKGFEKENRSVKRTARAAYSGVLSSISRVEALKKGVDFQQLALESKEEGYRSGLYNGLAVLDGERDLYLARRDFAKARYDYLLNSIRLKEAVGTLSEEDVASLNGLFE